MNIFVTGASGFIGSAIVNGLDKKDNTIFMGLRTNRDSNPHTIICDFSKDFSIDIWKERLKDIDIVINAVGIIAETKEQKFSDLHTKAPIALFKACELAGVKKVIQISALGTNANAITQYHKSKREADEYLRNSTLHYCILKPSIVYGEDGDNAEFIRAIGYIAKAKGMSAIAKDTGLGRESLYKAFNGDANPRFDTVMKVIKSLGIKLYTQTHVKKVAV